LTEKEMADRVSPINICNYYKLELLPTKAITAKQGGGKMPNKVLIFGKDA